MDNPHKSLFIISDATGRTAFRILEVALSQFHEPRVELVEQYSELTTVAQVQAAVAHAAQENALVVFTLVVPELRDACLRGCQEAGLSYIDLIEPVLIHISNWLGAEPSRRPGLGRAPQIDYFQRVMALDFALRHDDGQNAHSLERADVVLVGVSRTSKTPLAIFLAERYGLRTGNVPLVYGVDPPPALAKLPPNRVVGLTLNPDRLIALRKQRQSYMGLTGQYADPVHVRRELQQARTLFTTSGWRIIDMTSRSIEEAANEIAGQIGRGGSASTPAQ